MGVLLYALLCGSLPFEDDNLHILYKKITVIYYSSFYKKFRVFVRDGICLYAVQRGPNINTIPVKVLLLKNNTNSNIEHWYWNPALLRPYLTLPLFGCVWLFYFWGFLRPFLRFMLVPHSRRGNNPSSKNSKKWELSPIGNPYVRLVLLIGRMAHRC
jgi:hypothetical protein